MVWAATNPENCMQYTADTRHGYEDLSCLLTHDDTLKYFSPLAKTYMDWEFVTRLEPPSYKVIGATVAASAVIMSVGNFWMLWRRRPFQIRPIVTLWNCIWMILTGLGLVRMLPMVVHNWWHYSINDNVCAPAQSLWVSGTTGLWGVIWIYAKILEVVVESVLVVLLQQPCGLLQWFNNYAYVLIHGWHLYVSPVPGGSAVICIYYAIVWFMNLYCFYLNWYRLPQPQTPTALLDGIHLVQTLSGVFLSVTTLHYWKQAVWNHRACAANEPHIRMLAFSWSGGHVVIAVLSFLNSQFAKSQRRKRPTTAKKDGSSKTANGKNVTFAPNAQDGKKKKKKKLPPTKEQLPKSGKGDTPELVEESTSSTSDDAALKKKKKKKRDKNIPKNISIDSSSQDASEGGESPVQAVPITPAEQSGDDGGEWESAKKKKKKNKNKKTKSE